MKSMTLPDSAVQNRGELLYVSVYKALIAGMVLSNVLFVTGLILAIVLKAPIGSMLGEAHGPHLRHAAQVLSPVTILEAAIIILILTPIARVTVSLAAFLIDRDYKFAVMTAIVLTTITVTILLQI
jgi:uncharacterized membrane protein